MLVVVLTPWRKIQSKFLVFFDPLSHFHSQTIYRELLRSGKWKIRAAEGYALFPGSDHVETVIVFDSTINHNSKERRSRDGNSDGEEDEDDDDDEDSYDNVNRPLPFSP
jgi:hypothetical protein